MHGVRQWAPANYRGPDCTPPASKSRLLARRHSSTSDEGFRLRVQDQLANVTVQ